jgi:hypothetical protein
LTAQLQQIVTVFLGIFFEALPFLLTVVVVVTAPRIENVRIVDQSPNGVDIPLDTPIRVVFSRPVDQRSAERAFLIYPIVPGRFEWPDAQTMIFHPMRAASA